MIDHIGFPVSDYPRAKAFYLKALAPLGYRLVMEVTQEQNDGAAAAGFGANGKPDFWIGGEGGLNKPLHVAIAARDRATVDAFYQAALAAGGAIIARPASAPTTTPIATAPSCSITMATTSKPCATRRSDRFQFARRNIAGLRPLSLQQNGATTWPTTTPPATPTTPGT